MFYAVLGWCSTSWSTFTRTTTTFHGRDTLAKTLWSLAKGPSAFRRESVALSPVRWEHAPTLWKVLATVNRSARVAMVQAVQWDVGRRNAHSPWKSMLLRRLGSSAINLLILWTKLQRLTSRLKV